MLVSLRFLRSIQANPLFQSLKRMLKAIITPVLYLDYVISRNVSEVDFPTFTGMNQRVFVFAHHSKTTLDVFDREILNSMRKLGFYTIFVTDLKKTNQVTADLVLKKGSRGRDLGILRDFARIFQGTVFKSTEILFCNNSMMWNAIKFEKLVASLSEYPNDTFIFPSNSNNPSYHVQPYLVYINLSSTNYRKFQQSFDWIKNFRLKRSIVRFGEYPMSKRLNGMGWEQAVIAPYKSVHQNFSLLHEEDPTFRKLTTSVLLNPTQEMWDGLILSGIPGIKRSLVSLNPVGVINVPDSLESAFRQVFER